MGYIKAEDILPAELLRQVQSYAEGQLIYIPRRSRRSCWGSISGADRRAGQSVGELAARYFLSEKSIQRILRDGDPRPPCADERREDCR